MSRKMLYVGKKAPKQRPVYICIHPGSDNGICGHIARVYDPKHGMVCLNHAPKAVMNEHAA